MKIIDVILAAEGRVSGGSEYGWICYGPEARFMDFSDADRREVCNVVFDSKTQLVYEVQIFVPGYDQCFAWWDPGHIEFHHNESLNRGHDPLVAYDDVKFTVVDSEERILQYLKDVSATYYDDLPVPECA